MHRAHRWCTTLHVLTRLNFFFLPDMADCDLMNEQQPDLRIWDLESLQFFFYRISCFFTIYSSEIHMYSSQGHRAHKTKRCTHVRNSQMQLNAKIKKTTTSFFLLLYRLNRVNFIFSCARANKVNALVTKRLLPHIKEMNKFFLKMI